MSELDNLTLNEILRIGAAIPIEEWVESNTTFGKYIASRKGVNIFLSSSIRVDLGPSGCYSIRASYSGPDKGGKHELGEYYFHTEGKSVGGVGEKGDERIKPFYENIRAKVIESVPVRRKEALEAARRVANS